MIDDATIEIITAIANKPEVIKLCEPQVCFPQVLQKWMVVRTITVLELLQEALKEKK